jgi:excisionase family DNA binding protein
MESQAVAPEASDAPSPANGHRAPSSIEALRRRLHDVAKDRPFISILEAREVLGWSRAMTYRLVNNGTIPSTRTYGRARYISVCQLERFIVGIAEHGDTK